MSFQLHLEISGLCLLVRRASGLRILLPQTPAGGHKHFPRLGSEAKYQNQWSSNPHHGQQINGYIFHDLGRAPIAFDTKPHFPTAVNTQLQTVGVVNLPCGKAARPEAAYVQIDLPHGRPDTQGNLLGGACWTQPWLAGAPVMRMSTLITWTVDDLDNTIDGGAPGLQITVSAPDGTPYDVVLEPVGGVVNMFLFHTLGDEAPWLAPPQETFPPAGNIAPHFHHYYDLLAANHTCQVPVFYGKYDEGTCVPLPPSDHVFHIDREARGEEIDRVRFSDSSGRRYSCLLATTEE